MSGETTTSAAARELLLKAGREELERARDNIKLATQRLAKLVIQSPNYAALRDDLIEAGCRALLANLLEQRRRRLWQSAAAPQTRTRLLNTAQALLDYPLPGGKRVRHAGKAELLAAAAHYRRRAASDGAKARWLTRVAKGLEPGQTVAEAYDEAALQAMQKEHKHA